MSHGFVLLSKYVILSLCTSHSLNSEFMFLHMLKRVDCPLRVGERLLPQVEEFKYLRVLSPGEKKKEQVIERWIRAALAVMQMLN